MAAGSVSTRRGLEERDLPIWLRNAGYYNVQIGKYLNGYGGSPASIPPGWDEWYGKLSEYDASVHGGRLYFNYQIREDPPAAGGVRAPAAPRRCRAAIHLPLR